MMDKIDGWVVNTALRQLAQMQQQGYRDTFTINLSGRTITNMALIESIEELLIEETGLSSSRSTISPIHWVR